MADKQISDLVAATAVQTTDLFVLEQSGTAKKLTGQTLENWLVALADGHGGIQSVELTGTSGLQKTYTITYADTTTSTFVVVDGRGITGLTWVDSGTPRNGASHTGTFAYNDGTTSNVVIYDGLKGDTGDAWYIHIKYASEMPTSNSDMGDVPDNWIGIYSGTSQTAPANYTSYTWFQWKGDTGNTGAAATITSQSVGYMVSESGTVAPEGSWQSTVPTVPQGSFLWTRTRLTYNTGSVVTSYSVARFGVDGAGSVSSVNNVSPDGDGNVALAASDIPTSDSTSVQQHITSIESDVSDLQTYEVRHITGSITSLPKSFSYAFITAEHRVINISLGTPSALISDLAWTTSAGDVTFTGTLATDGTTTIDFDIVKVVTP